MRLVAGCALLMLAICGCSAGRGVRVDGSSTVYPVSLAMAEEFSIQNPSVNISVAYSGTGGGLSKLCNGEVDVAGASRVIKTDELVACAARGIEVVELPIAADAITVVVNGANDWARCLALDELSEIWEPDSQVSMWSDVRSEWPREELVLFGPGTDSGTFDYFTEAVNGETGATRTDFFPSEDDNVLLHGVSAGLHALGYFGYGHFAKSSAEVRSVAVDSGEGCVQPTAATIADNSYQPLSRPLFLYVAEPELGRPDVAAFAAFYLRGENRQLVAGSGYVAYPDDVYAAAADRLEGRVTGSSFLGFAPGDSVLEAVRSR